MENQPSSPNNAQIKKQTKTPSSLFKTDIVDKVLDEHVINNRLKPVAMDNNEENSKEGAVDDMNGQQEDAVADQVSSDGMSSPIDEMMI